MSKDPAFLFYSSDFLTGIIDLTMEERGQYITLLCLQHQKGRLSEKTIRLTLGSVSVDVLAKFKKDENELYYNERLKTEIEKRASFIDSRRENGKLGGRPKKPSGKPSGKPSAKPSGKAKKKLPEDDNENENETINANKDTKDEYMFFDNPEINILFLDYLEVRKKKKMVTTDRALNLLLNKLNGRTDDIKKQMLEEAITGEWKSVYVPKSNQAYAVHKETQMDKLKRIYEEQS